MRKVLMHVVIIVFALFSCLGKRTIAFACDNYTTMLSEKNNKENVKLVCDEITRLEDGGLIYKYHWDGAEIECPVPPEEFNPLDATSEELEIYGFPEKPTNEDELINWEYVMNNYSKVETPSITVIYDQFSSEYVYSNEVDYECEDYVVDNYNAVNSKNWSGYYVTGKTFNTVYGDIVQPSISSAAYNTYCSYWVGLGGCINNSEKLVQCGTASTYSVSSGKDYYAWYEYLGTDGNGVSEIRIDNLAVNPGDKIHFYCSFQRDNNIANFYIANNTTGKSQSFKVTLSSSIYYDGSTAEWIVERPLLVYSDFRTEYAKLSKYDECIWTNCHAMDMNGTIHSISSTSINSVGINMRRTGSNVLLSSVSDINGDSFTCNWHAFK